MGLSPQCAGALGSAFSVQGNQTVRVRPWLAAPGPAGSQCISTWEGAERAGTWEYLRSLTAPCTCPLEVAPFCYAEEGVKRWLAVLSWGCSAARFNGRDPTSAADSRAGSQVLILPSQAGSLECHGPDSEFIACWMWSSLGCWFLNLKQNWNCSSWQQVVGTKVV